VFSQQVDIEKRGFIAFGVAWMRYREVLLVNKMERRFIKLL